MAYRLRPPQGCDPAQLLPKLRQLEEEDPQLHIVWDSRLGEIRAQLPAELKQSRTIVESRNELISQARREAENIVRQAQEQSKQMVTKEAIYAEAKKRSEELVGQTQAKIEQLRKAGNAYMDDSLRQTEEVVSKALAEIRETRMKFRTVTEAQQQRKTPNVDVEV